MSSASFLSMSNYWHPCCSLWLLKCLTCFTCSYWLCFIWYCTVSSGCHNLWVVTWSSHLGCWRYVLFPQILLLPPLSCEATNDIPTDCSLKNKQTNKTKANKHTHTKKPPHPKPQKTTTKLKNTTNKIPWHVSTDSIVQSTK